MHRTCNVSDSWIIEISRRWNIRSLRKHPPCDPSHSIVERARYEPVCRPRVIFIPVVWSTATVSEPRHLIINGSSIVGKWVKRDSIYRCIERACTKHATWLCACEMQNVCIIPCHPILRELSELWHVAERMNACRNRHSFQLRMGEEDARIIGRLCLYKCVIYIYKMLIISLSKR